MKNLVMGVVKGYGWYELEPFVRSFQRHCENADLVLFVDNVSDFTRDKLKSEGVELLPFPEEIKDVLVINARWSMYKKFLDERGGDYKQVFLTDTRDVICQENLFENYAESKNFLCYTTEDENIKNPKETTTYGWIARFFGRDESEKLGNRKIICCGTVLATIDEAKNFSAKMIEILQRSTLWGDEQAVMNYLVYENLLDIENIIELDCYSGNILTAGMFYKNHPITIDDEKILRGDGGVPAAVHQYTWYPELTQLINKIYREKDFQPDENFSDLPSMLDQIICTANVDKLDYAFNLFTKYLYGKNFNGYADKLLTLWEIISDKNISPAKDFLTLSIQWALIGAFTFFSVQQINRLKDLTNSAIKNNSVVTLQFKLFIGTTLIRWLNNLCDKKRFSNCLEYVDTLNALNVPMDSSVYLLQAKIYRELGMKADALAAYEKALNI